VREYIPEFRLHDAIASDRVTMCHHSGLPRHDWIWLLGDLLPAQIPAAIRYLEPRDDIRSIFQYSNLGYLVASMVAERVHCGGACRSRWRCRALRDGGGHPPALEALAC
jgi:CubicO group peptidase (beta-lactamase class C family)